MSWRPMLLADLDDVVAIEQRAYSHPWTRGQFADSLAAGYESWLLRRGGDELVGYYVVMPVLDEIHLLNLTVDPDQQRQGHGRALMTHMLDVARLAGAASVWLEVRQSNTAALQLYAGFGFERVGQRRDYYPTGRGQREAAQVMRLLLPDDDDALD